MNTLTAVVALLQVAVALLTNSVGTPYQPQALEIAQQAVVLAQKAISEQEALNIAPASPTVTPTASSSAPSSGSTPNTMDISNIAPSGTSTAPVSQARIEIVKPSNFNSRSYVANDYKLNPDGTIAAGSTAPTDDNIFYVTAIVYDELGNVVRNAKVQITTTDSNQNKTLNGTGAVNQTGIYYYPFNYEIRKKGVNTITFSAEGLNPASIEIVAQ